MLTLAHCSVNPFPVLNHYGRCPWAGSDSLGGAEGLCQLPLGFPSTTPSDSFGGGERNRREADGDDPGVGVPTQRGGLWFCPGQGGFQDLLFELQNKLDEGNNISLDSDEIERIIRYGLEYEQGGFQKRLLGIIHGLESMKVSITGLR